MRVRASIFVMIIGTSAAPLSENRLYNSKIRPEGVGWTSG